MEQDKDLLFSLREVTIRYPDGTAFPRISFAVRRGEHWALVGGNEPLKTALLEALAGKAAIIGGTSDFPFYTRFVQQQTGAQEPLLSPARLVALVSSRHHFRNLSNTEQFYYQQRYNSSDAENSLTVAAWLSAVRPLSASPVWTVHKVVEALELQPLLQKHLILLSSGETRRTLIAAALLRNPVLLLLNQPLAGLDPEARQAFGRLLDRIAAAGTTIIMTGAPAEVPAAITHLALAGEGPALRPVPKSDLPALLEAGPEVPAIDVGALKALLDRQPLPPFGVMVAMKNVTIRYGEKVILDGIDFRVGQGERWAVLGHNGAGKSTLLSLISGDNPQAFANDIVLFDRKKGSGESIWDIKKKIGFVSPELYQYFPVETSCLQTVESGFYDTIGLFRPSRPETAAVAQQWMQLLGIGHLARKLLKQVPASSQRLCLMARALVKNPPLLILDEPCQGFDDGQRAYFKRFVDTLCAHSNITLLYVSHYREEIPDSVTRFFRLRNGRGAEEVVPSAQA